MQHTFVAYVEDKPGVLTRVAFVVPRLNINISSVPWAGRRRPNISRMTLVADAPPAARHRIMASLYKLENVIQVDDVGRFFLGERELALIKVATTPKTRSHIFELVNVFRARVVDLAPGSLMNSKSPQREQDRGPAAGAEPRTKTGCLRYPHRAHGDAPRHHTSRVLEALGDVESQNGAVGAPMADALPEEEETLPSIAICHINNRNYVCTQRKG